MSPLQAQSLFLFVKAETPAGTMGLLSTAECTNLPTYLHLAFDPVDWDLWGRVRTPSHHTPFRLYVVQV